MIRYIIYKFCVMVFTLWLIMTSVFFIMKVLPGSPFDVDQSMSETIRLQLEDKYGLNQPISKQYIRYLKNVVTLDLGYSYKMRGESVTQIIKKAAKHSIIIGLWSIIISITCGVTLGVVSLKKSRKIINKLTMFGVAFGIAIPNFILAMFFMYFFSYKLKWIPIGKISSLKVYVGPIIVLSVYPCAFIIKIIRESMIKAIHEPYVNVFESYGLSEKKLLFKYVLKMTLLPLITYLSSMIASIIMGSFAVEKIFLIPGLGTIFINSVISRDYYVCFGLLIFYASVYLCIIFVTDIFYCIIDPRVKFSFLLKKKN